MKMVKLKNEISSDWEFVKLEDVIKDIYYGITAKAVEDNTDIRMLRTTDIKNYSVDWESLPYCEITEKNNNLQKYFLKKDDLIVARAGTVGVSVLIERDFDNTIFGSYLIKIRLKSNILPKFVHYFFQTDIYWNHITKAQGSTLKNITLPLLKSLKIPLPPLHEQRKIAEILSTVDDAIQKVSDAIARTERLKKGLMQRLLTKGIGHKRFKFSKELGCEIPEEWKIIKLKEKAEIKEGLYGKRGNGGIIQLKADSILEGKINTNNYALISVSGDISEYILKPNDILISNRNSADQVGKSAIFKGEFKECVYSNLLTRIRVISDDLLPEWVLYILTKMKCDGVLRVLSTRAVNQVLLRKGIVENLKIPLPPLHEQQKIAEILSTVDKKLELERKRKEKLERIKKGLMNDLLTGRKRVKVEV